MTTVDELLKDAGLNRNQKKFCKIPPQKNVRLLAPAGAGKTFSLLWRCRCIQAMCEEKGLPAPHFLIVTFTRAARSELEVRIQNDPRFNGLRMTIRTLNAWGWEQIKTPGKELITTSYSRQSIVTHDLLPLINKHDNLAKTIKTAYLRRKNSNLIMDLIDGFKGLGFSHTMRKTEFRAHIRYLKTLGLDHYFEGMCETLWKMEGVSLIDKKAKEAALNDFFTFWKKAVVNLEAVGRFTLEDQKYWAKCYFEKQMADGKYPQGITRYTHIIVDEFQDINPLDMALLQAAAKYHGQGKAIPMTIIGDDDQAIFGWRGTTPNYILDPEQYLGEPFVTCVLETNYRSPKNLVEVSNRLISYNKNREPKEMRSVAKGKASIKLLERKKRASSFDSTITLIHNLIEKKGCRQVALIARRQVSLFPYQVLLSAEGTDYYVAADIDIFEGEAMQSLQNILQIVYRAKADDIDDPADAILTICDKVDRYQLNHADREKISRYINASGAYTFAEALDALHTYPESIKRQPVELFCSVIEALISAKTVYDFMQVVENDLQGLQKDYTKKDKDNHYKEPQFFRLTALSSKYGDDFRRFYRDIEKARKAGEWCRKRNSSDDNSDHEKNAHAEVQLFTATRSKGHEFDAVIILDTNDAEWPVYNFDDIEEERRLFYVAMTRAKRYLYFQKDREDQGSRFLLEAGLM